MDGLEPRSQLATTLERLAELALGADAPLDQHAHVVGEHRVGVAADVLGAVHRGVGVTQDRVGVALAARHGDADRRPDGCLEPTHDERAVERRSDEFGERVLGDRVLIAHRDELVATDPAEHHALREV